MIDYINKIYNCDFLEIIDELPDEIFDLLILDLPYNLKKDFPNDNLTPIQFKKKLREWINVIVPKLKEKGSLYVFMGYEYVDYLKKILSKELIFRREIIWYYKDSNSKMVGKNYLPEFDKILFFTKSDEYIFNILRKKPSKKYYKEYKDKADENGNVPYEKLYPITKKEYKKENYEKHPKNIFKGKPMGNVIVIGKLAGNTPEIRFGKHNTQKPERLIDIFIKVSSNEGDLVGDFFMGSGTTCVVAKKLRRKYFGTEINESNFNITKKRLEHTNIFNNILKFTTPEKKRKGKTLLDFQND